MTIARLPPPVKRKRVDTIWLTREIWNSYEKPEAQRPTKDELPKVAEVAREIKVTGVFPGILTIGLFAGKEWVIDGLHRGAGFMQSGRSEVLCDVHYIECASQADIAKEFIKHQTSIVRFLPDDRLRALEVAGCAALSVIRGACPFVGYGNLRRSGSATPRHRAIGRREGWGRAQGKAPYPPRGPAAAHRRLTRRGPAAARGFRLS